MKKLFAALFFCSFLVACSGWGSSIVGTWQLESVSGEKLTESEKKSTFDFKKDGSCSMQRGDRSREGSYTIEEQEGKQILIIDMGKRKEISIIHAMDANKLVFIQKRDTITLKRK